MVCRGSTSVVKCTYCRSEFPSTSKSQSACKKCEHYLSKYGKPTACECCKIVAAFGSSKCMRCASYEAKYGPPTQCDECKLRSAFDRRDENKKVNGKVLCWLCTCAYKRALLKAQQEGRISMSKKRPHEKSSSTAHREGHASAKKSTRGGDISKGTGNINTSGVTSVSGVGLDLPDKISRGNSGNGTIAAPAAITVDTNSSDHVVAITYLKERIASLEKRLNQKDKELLEKDKQLTELKGKNFEKENEMRNRLKEVERLHDMKVDNLNRKVASLLKDLAVMKKSNNKKGGGVGGVTKAEKEAIKRENLSPKEELVAVPAPDKQSKREPERDLDKDEKSRDRDEERSDQDRGSVHSRSGSSSPSSN
ncbi:protein FAM76A isoform X2 [Drosophila novamexicana]|uniref:protein FAM76A isoform X2 n=1 Tax=Drosophila novamexicana TaxID=47314 RepID=UPI0011E59C7A|nr:protein FAM76A isoform X2 [Drosophila novamexicana]